VLLRSILLAAPLTFALFAATPPRAPFTQGAVLFADDFRGGLAQWTAETEKPGRIEARDGVLSVDVPAGCTMWFRPELEGAVMIEYDARMVKNGGANDRVSDLNAFWMATDARSPGDLFATRRSGKFTDYNQLRTYYVGQGGNGNTTTRFRRYIGSVDERPLLPEHDLRSPEVLLEPNAWQTVQLVALGNRIQYYRDGRLLFDFTDPAPYTRGRFGFRTTFSHVELRNFRVYRIAAAAPVTAREDAETIRLDNGLVSLEYSKKTATFQGIWRWVDGKRQPSALGEDAYYWDSVSIPATVRPGTVAPGNRNFRVKTNPGPLRLLASEDSAEIVATALHNDWYHFDVEVHHVLRRGDAGFYSWAILRHPSSLPAADFEQMRFVSKTVTDGTFTDFLIGEARAKTIDRSEKVQELSNATYRLADGTVSTKYQNSSYWAETPVYGHAGPRLGLWSITASPEFFNGGPLKQGQTVHDNVLLRVMTSAHFGAAPVHVAQDEEWSKMYGPVFTYLNEGAGPRALWEDARARQAAEAAAWPYRWVSSPEYVKQRGTLTGTWKLKGEAALTGAWVVLAAPATPDAPDWTLQSKGYQFWARTGPDGAFTIRNVIPGRYTLYVSGADQPSQYIEDGVEIAAGKTALHDVEWTAERHGTTLWQIGTFDRTAAEFRNGGNARDFEMFKRYRKEFPEDVTFTIGESDPARDWNYAQWSLYSRKPVWAIRFRADGVQAGAATLTLAFASAQPARGPATNLEVKVNGTLVDTVHLPKTGTAGYRRSAQDSPWNVRRLRFDAALLRPGMNEITLGHAEARQFPGDGNVRGPVGQVMYDAIRLEVQRQTEPRP
jgi:rhamnogalacturonan endolyase